MALTNLDKMSIASTVTLGAAYLGSKYIVKSDTLNKILGTLTVVAGTVTALELAYAHQTEFLPASVTNYTKIGIVDNYLKVANDYIGDHTDFLFGFNPLQLAATVHEQD